MTHVGLSRTMIAWLGVALFSVTTTAGTALWADGLNWPQFRGPTGDAVATAGPLPVTWSAEEGVDWQVDIEGVAWSQPIVWGQQVLLTTAIADDQPKPRLGESGAGFSLFSRDGFARSLSGGLPPQTIYRWKLICLDLASGSRQWERLVRESAPTIPIHRSNSYASETPATDGKHVYVYIAMAGVYCFDMEGREVWAKELDSWPMQFGWGTGSSPLLHEDTLFIQCDNERASYLVALDKSDGSERWRVERDELSNWSTPYIWRNRVRTELVTCGGRKTRSYGLASGELLWELPASGRAVTSGVGDQELLYVGSVTRSMGASGTLTAIRAGASGDLSRDKANDSFVAWSVRQAAPEVASPLLHNNRLYTLRQHGGILTCLDAGTGERLYRARLPGAGPFTASPWASEQHVYCLDENGTTFVINAGPALQVLAENQLEGMFWSSPALGDGWLLLRSADQLFRLSSNEVR